MTGSAVPMPPAGAAVGEDLFETLMGANSRAFAEGCYDTAYHLLAAAYYRVVDLGILQPAEGAALSALLAEVEATAAEQAAAIDARPPAQALGDAAARRRSNMGGIYHALASTARTRSKLLAAGHFPPPEEPGA